MLLLIKKKRYSVYISVNSNTSYVIINRYMGRPNNQVSRRIQIHLMLLLILKSTVRLSGLHGIQIHLMLLLINLKLMLIYSFYIIQIHLMLLLIVFLLSLNLLTLIYSNTSYVIINLIVYAKC